MHYDINAMIVFDNDGNLHEADSIEGAELLKNAAKAIRFEKATHRCHLFYRTETGKDDRFEKVLLEDKGAFWVTDKNTVYLKTIPQPDRDKHSEALFFTLPLVDDGEIIPRPPQVMDAEKVKAIHNYGQLFWDPKPYVEGDVPRAWTREEMTEQLLHHFIGMVDYWDSVDIIQVGPMSQKERMHGLLFSILSTLDGSSMGIPGFILTPSVTAEDQQFNEAIGENWWPVWEGEIPDEYTINYPLHEILTRMNKE